MREILEFHRELMRKMNMAEPTDEEDSSAGGIPLKIVAVDIDGTLCRLERHKPYADREPIRENIDLVNSLYDDGCYIKIYTARHNKTCGRNLDIQVQRMGDLTISWLQKHGVKYHEVLFTKEYFDILIDDLVVRPGEVRTKQDVYEAIKTLGAER